MQASRGWHKQSDEMRCWSQDPGPQPTLSQRKQTTQLLSRGLLLLPGPERVQTP